MAFVLALGALLLLSIWVFQGRIASMLVRRALHGAGVEVSWTRFELEGLSRASVAGLHARRAPDMDLSADALEIHFDVLSLVRGGLAGIESVTARGAALEIGPFGASASATAGQGAPFRWPTAVPKLDLEFTRAVVHVSSRRRIELERARIRVDEDGAACEADRAAWVDGDDVRAHPLSVQSTYHDGQFALRRATWDPRFTLHHATADLALVGTGQAAFDARFGFLEADATLEGNVADAIVALHAEVSALDVGAALAAFAPLAGIDLAGRANVSLDARLPWNAPGTWTGNARIEARDVRAFGTDVDLIAASIAAGTNGLSIDDGFIVHGANAVSVAGVCPRPPFDRCTWLERTSAWLRADVGDLTALLRDDVRLATARGDTASGTPGETPWEPISVWATLAGTEVDGRVRASSVDLAGVLALFDAEAVVEGRVDVDARVHVPLARPAQVSVDAKLEAVEVAYGGRRADVASARVKLDDRAFTILDAFVVQGSNTCERPLARLPALPFDACTLRQESTAQVRADCSDLSALLRTERENSALERLPAHHLVLQATLLDDALDLEQGEFTAAGSVVHIERGRVPWHDDLRSILTDDRLDVAFGVRFDDVADVLSIVAPHAFERATGFALREAPRGFLAGRARLRGSADGPVGRLALRARNLELEAATFDEVDVELDVDERDLRVVRLDARSSLGSVSGAGRYTFATRRVTEARLDADVLDLARLAPDWLPSGSVVVHAQADGEWSALDGSIRLEGHDLSWRGTHVEDVVLSASANQGVVRLHELSGRSHGVDARLSGSLGALGHALAPRRIVLDTLEVGGGSARSALVRPATIEITDSDWSFRDVVLEGSAGAMEADVSFSNDVWCADVRVNGVIPAPALARVAAFVPPLTRVDGFLSGRLDHGVLYVDTRGRIDAPASDALGTPAAAIVWNAHLADGRAVVDEFVLDTPDARLRSRIDIDGSFPLDFSNAELLADGPLTLHVAADVADLAWLHLPSIPRGASGRVRLRADLTGAWTGVRGTVTATAEALTIPASLRAPTLGPASCAVRVTLADAVSIDEGRFLLAEDADVRAAGSLATVLDMRAIAHGDTRSILDAPLDLALDLKSADLAPITALLPAIRRTGGHVTASLRATGTPRAPRLEGTASLDDGEIRTATNVPSIVGVSSRMRLEGTRLEIDTLTGEMGGAPFSMHGSVGVFDADPRVDLALEGSSLLLWRQSDVSVRADARLALTGTISSLLLTGDLALRDGRYTKKLDFLAFGKRGPATARRSGLRLFSLDEPPFSTMTFDVRVSSVNPFTISNNVLRGRIRPALVLGGTGALPELRGDVLVEPSRVLLPSGTLRVRSGRIEFRPDQPDVPVLDIQAGARFQGYDIEVNVSGPYDNPRVDLSSVPPLSREDLALLLITGRPPGNGLSLATGQRAAVDVAVYIARDVAAAWVAGDDDEIERLAERLEVVVGADTTRSGADALLVRMRLGGDTGRQRNAVYITGERDLYDFYNFGVRLVLSLQ